MAGHKMGHHIMDPVSCGGEGLEYSERGKEIRISLTICRGPGMP
jgi:hypothetical protein